MREIKFRAWSPQLKKMSLPFGLFAMGPRFPVPATTETLSINDSFEVMQYTGLKDKNDRDIYEGDITNLGVVKFQTDLNWDGGGSIHSGFYFDIEKTGGEMSYHDRLNECIVIGNIYENPELVKP